MRKILSPIIALAGLDLLDRRFWVPRELRGWRVWCPRGGCAYRCALWCLRRRSWAWRMQLRVSRPDRQPWV